jgi:hypothetical protein
MARSDICFQRLVRDLIGMQNAGMPSIRHMDPHEKALYGYDAEERALDLARDLSDRRAQVMDALLGGQGGEAEQAEYEAARDRQRAERDRIDAEIKGGAQVSRQHMLVIVSGLHADVAQSADVWLAHFDVVRKILLDRKTP